MAFALSDKSGAPPDSELVYRANLGSADDMKLLLKKGGNIHAVNNNGIGLIFLAASRIDPESINVLEVLLSAGLDINSRSPEGRTPLFFAAKSGNKETVKYLLEKGADPYITDHNGDVARNYAYKNGHMDVVELMDDFARKKIAEVNSAYERVNEELKKRYEELAKRQRALAKAAAQSAAQATQPSASAVNESEKSKEQLAAEKERKEKAALEEMRAELAREAARSEAIRKKEKAEEARKAAEELRKSLQNAAMKAYMKSEIEAEAAAMKREQELKELNDPKLREAHLEKERKIEEEKSKLFEQLSYHNCQFQYWYYCYSSKMTTDLDADALRDIIESSKNKIATAQNTLIHDYDVKPSEVQKVSLNAKLSIFNQLDSMHSSRQRRSEGVGGKSDSEERCNVIAFNWDIAPAPKPEEASPEVTPANSAYPMPATSGPYTAPTTSINTNFVPQVRRGGNYSAPNVYSGKQNRKSKNFNKRRFLQSLRP